MIRFRQKEYVVPVAAALGSNTMLNALTAGSLGLGVLQMGQASSQAKDAERQQQEALAVQKRENAKLTKSLDRLAKSAQGNPQVMAQAGHMVGQTRLYSFGKNATTFAKDLTKAIGKGNIGKTSIKLGMAGVGTSLVGYATDKAITRDARKIGLMKKEEQEKQYSVMSSIGTNLKKGIQYAGSKKNLKEVGGWAVFGALPALGYLSQRKQYKDQLKSQQPQQELGQKSYSIVKNLTNAAKGLTKDWAGWKSVTGGITRMSSMWTIGRRDVQRVAKNLQKEGNGTWAKKLGKGMEQHQNLANLGTAGLVGTSVAGIYNQSEKLTKKGLGKVDKDAYAYEKFSEGNQN